MAHSLSPQFLTEDEKSFINKLFTNDAVSSSTTLFPYDDVSISELTRQMTHSSLHNKVTKKIQQKKKTITLKKINYNCVYFS